MAQECNNLWPSALLLVVLLIGTVQLLLKVDKYSTRWERRQSRALAMIVPELPGNTQLSTTTTLLLRIYQCTSFISLMGHQTSLTLIQFELRRSVTLATYTCSLCEGETGVYSKMNVMVDKNVFLFLGLHDCFQEVITQVSLTTCIHNICSLRYAIHMYSQNDGESLWALKKAQTSGNFHTKSKHLLAKAWQI